MQSSKTTARTALSAIRKQRSIVCFDASKWKKVNSGSGNQGIRPQIRLAGPHHRTFYYSSATKRLKNLKR
jgi:hypothetical protein